MKIDQDKQLHLADSLIKSSSVKTKNDAAKTATNTADGSAGVSDKVELSGWKAEVSRLKEKVKALPDVNEEKVAKMRQALQSDTYNVKGELVARSMLKSQLLDEIL
jgi:negative regulator of flagellin synthesis FlgM